jgi:hypothetical protein
MVRPKIAPTQKTAAKILPFMYRFWLSEQEKPIAQRMQFSQYGCTTAMLLFRQSSACFIRDAAHTPAKIPSWTNAGSQGGDGGLSARMKIILRSASRTSTPKVHEWVLGLGTQSVPGGADPVLRRVRRACDQLQKRSPRERRLAPGKASCRKNGNCGILYRGQIAIGPCPDGGAVGLNQVGILSWILVLID